LNIKKQEDFLFIGRFLSILGVIAVHSVITINHFHPEKLNLLFYKITYQGSLGVYFFFLISGYTLFNSYKIKKENTFIYFYIRRIFRIAPLYYLIGIFFYFIFRHSKYFYVNGVIIFDPIYNFKNILSNLFFLHGFIPSANNNIVPGGWSIANEMFYCLLFPILLRVKNVSLSRVFISIIFFIFLEFLFTKIFFTKYNYLNFLFHQTISPVLFFIFGIYFSYNYNYFNRRKINIFLIIIFIFLAESIFKSKILFMTFLSMFFIRVLLFIKSKIKFNFYLKKHLVNYGKYSFSAYLIHFFIIDLLKYFLLDKYLYIYNIYLSFLIFLLVTIIITYYFSFILNIFEKKFVNLGRNLIKYLKLNYKF
jgi:peptidoglycan/LPS O-acetylase OafA/YrhL